MPIKHPDPPQLSVKERVALLDTKIKSEIDLIRALAEQIELNAERHGREPLATEEDVLKFHRAELRKNLKRRERLLCP